MRRLRLKLTLLAAAALTAVAADQAAQYTLLSSGSFRGRRIAPYDPPIFHGAQQDSLERARGLLDGSVRDELPVGFDAQLGWVNRPGMELDIYGYDWAGCRSDGVPTLKVKDPERVRIAAYGCSFTHGDGVALDETWAAQLEATQPSLELLNLGVGGYGLDQALLRQRATAADFEPDEVWLCLFPAAGLRVTTRFRPIVRHWSSALAFKPRFVVDEDGELEWLPNPAEELADVVRLCEDQDLFLERTAPHDAWIERAPTAYAPAGSHPFHWSAAARLLITGLEIAGRDHDLHVGPRDAEAHRILDAIVRASAEETEALGARFRLLVLPGPTDLAYIDEHGRGYWQNLVDDLAADGVEVVDLSEALLAARAEGPALFLGDGHYNRAGNGIVARALAQRTAGSVQNE